MDAIEFLNIGAEPDDGTGDSARDGAAKLNRNNQKFKAAIDSLAGLNIVAGPVTKLAPGANPTASLTGAAPNYTLTLGLPEGAAGAGAPNSADILSIAEKGRLERALAAAGVPDEPSLILDFLRGVHFASRVAQTATVIALIGFLAGVSVFSRASTATFCGSDGLLKTAANNALRLDFDPKTRLVRGFLVENQARTNSNTYSEQLDHSSYSKARCSVVADALSDMYGTTTMDKIVEDTSVSNSHYVFRNIGMGSGNLVEQCYSEWVLAAGRSKGRLFFCDFDTLTRQISVDFDLAAGSVGAVSAFGGAVAGTAGIEDWGGGLYRVYVTGTLGGGTSTQPRIYLADGSGNVTYTGDGVSGMGSIGWQIEIGSKPSSYIPTPGASAVTRAADNLAIDISKWLASSGPVSVALECMIDERNPVASSILYLGDASGQNAIRMRETVAGGVNLQASAAGNSAFSSPIIAATLRTPIRMAFALDAGGYAFSKDNGAPDTGVPTALPTGMTHLYLGVNFMGHIRRVIVYPQRLSNTKIQALSNQAAWS